MNIAWISSLLPTAATPLRFNMRDRTPQHPIAFLLWGGLLWRRHVIDQFITKPGAANVITTVMTMEMNQAAIPW
jgi:hypothetical protein